MQSEPLTAALRKALDLLPYDELVERIGDPDHVHTEYAQGQGYWSPGDGRPMVDASVPATAQAVGRCAVARIRFGELGAKVGAVHRPCEWEDYPLLELLKGCDYGTFMSRYVVAEIAAWEFADGQRYVASTGRAGEYDNPAWARFFVGVTPSTRSASPSEKRTASDIRRRMIEVASRFVDEEKPMSAEVHT